MISPCLLVSMCSLTSARVLQDSQAWSNPRTNSSEKIRFMKSFWTWTKQSDIFLGGNNLILNFGVGDFPYNSIRKSFVNIF